MKLSFFILCIHRRRVTLNSKKGLPIRKSKFTVVLRPIEFYKFLAGGGGTAPLAPRRAAYGYAWIVYTVHILYILYIYSYIYMYMYDTLKVVIYSKKVALMLLLYVSVSHILFFFNEIIQYKQFQFLYIRVPSIIIPH